MCREEEKRGKENASPAHTRPSADNRVRHKITLLSFVVTISVLHEAQYSGSTILVHYERKRKKRKREGQTRGLCVNEGMRTLADAAGQST